MELKPGYKQTEVGVFPEDWPVVLLDSVAKRGSGHTPDKAHPEYWNGNIKWVSLQDSDRLDRLYIFDTAAKITPDGIANSSARMHPAGTVVLSRDAGVGKSSIMAIDMAVSQHFIAWTCGTSLDNHFLYYLLQANKSEFERIAMGSTIKTIGLPFFRQLQIPLPARAEQEGIAEALSDADALIESLEQLLVKKRQVKQGAMQELLTGKIRLPGFTGKWETKRLGDVADTDPEISAVKPLPRTVLTTFRSKMLTREPSETLPRRYSNQRLHEHGESYARMMSLFLLSGQIFNHIFSFPLRMGIGFAQLAFASSVAEVV